MFTKLLEFISAEAPEPEPSITKYRQLRFGIDGGYKANSVIKIKHFREPLPETLRWLAAPNAVDFELQPNSIVDGEVDVEVSLAGERAIEEARRQATEPPKRYWRADIRQRYNWDDHQLNDAVASRILPSAHLQLERPHIGGAVVAANEYWYESDVVALDRFVQRLFPACAPKP